MRKNNERLTAGEPLEYIRGYTEFLGCKIDLSKKPLIPRAETEFWAQQAVNNILTFSRMLECPVKILDMFSGSGCIGLAVLKNVKNSNVTFADKDKKCLEQIRINIEINQPLHKASAWRSKIIRSDIFSNVQEKFDYIFANPPYVAISKINKVQKSVLEYEPRIALFGGKDGLFYIRKFLKQAKSHLNKNGKIFMEFSPEQKNKIEKLLKQFKYKNWEFHKDQYGKWRWCVVE